MPDEFRHLAPAWLPQGKGRVALVAPNLPEPPRRSGTLLPRVRIKGDFDPEVRLKDMDAMGIERQLLNPEFGQYAYETEPRLAAAMCQSANQAIGNVIRAHADRFIGSAVIPTQNIKASGLSMISPMSTTCPLVSMPTAETGGPWPTRCVWVQAGASLLRPSRTT
jgi:hypothetical protein